MHLGGYNGFYMMVGSHIYTDPGGCCFVNACIGQGKKYFSWFSRVRSMSGLTGAQSAQRILDYAGHPGCTDCSYIRQSDRSLRPGEKTSGSFGECVWTKFRGGHCSGGTRMWSCITACQSLLPPFPSGQHWSRLQILVPVLPGFLSWEGFCLVFSR